MKILQGAAHHPSEEKMEKLLGLGRPLIIKAGFDPTKDDMHLGHAVLLYKLRQFQDLGHTVVLVLGDFTATIGDPSGKNEARQAMDIAVTRRNANRYSSVAFKILDERKTHVVRNSTWFGTFSATDLLRLTSLTTVARMLERNDFSKRYTTQTPIHLHEFIYPLLQGWDSVEIAKRFGHCDIELGGFDQLFNLLVGRDLMRHEGFEPQEVMAMPLLVGTDASMIEGIIQGPKMSKSLNNYIGLSETPDSFLQKTMLIKDEAIWYWMDLLGLDKSPLVAKASLSSQPIPTNMREIKNDFARMLMARLYSPEEIDAAFTARTVVSAGGAPPDTKTVTVPMGIRLANALTSAGLTDSNSEATRLIKGGAVRIDDQVINDTKQTVTEKILVRVGTKNRSFVWLEPKGLE